MEVPQLQFPNKVDEMPVGYAETDPHGPDCSEDRRDSTVAVY